MKKTVKSLNMKAFPVPKKSASLPNPIPFFCHLLQDPISDVSPICDPPFLKTIFDDQIFSLSDLSAQMSFN